MFSGMSRHFKNQSQLVTDCIAGRLDEVLEVNLLQVSILITFFCCCKNPIKKNRHFSKDCSFFFDIIVILN